MKSLGCNSILAMAAIFYIAALTARGDDAVFGVEYNRLEYIE